MHFSTEQSLEQLAVLVSYPADTGHNCNEDSTLHIIDALIHSGVKVDVLVLGNGEQFLQTFTHHPDLTVRQLRANTAWLAVPELKRYLQRHPGQLLLAVQDQVIQAASMANLLSGLQGNVVGLMHETHWQQQANGTLDRVRYGLMRLLYRYTSGVIALSASVGMTLQLMTHLPTAKVKMLGDPFMHEVAISSYISLLTQWQCCGVCSVNSARYLSA